ncbi:DUF4325 domain-containing protein [Chryseobacterium takakiae]|uniref:DUF4325 domain-containing protein n=1 Tax=Chryseobacterium takakiae TaxID=1302685 RepID=A0A1M4ZZK0_9FLAO|nr:MULTISPECIES: DUF4325 domain-containing protein [Chryseobacterium]WEK69627.1 MAG: hypothetical protein P0Y62_17640 [Chryseobacterium sp.]SHF23401.1 hypothetical protein SAMN05444408_111102 [Chryseobacterium takakiae]
MEINLGDFKNSYSSVFTGRPQGKLARQKLNLDKIDNSSEVIYVIIPDGVSSINPSFFLGLFFDSYKKLKDKFNTKYKFKFLSNNPETINVLQENINDALRNAHNSVNVDFNNLFKL